MTNAPGYPCPKCGNVVLYTHGAIGRPVWCFCRSCGTMFNPEHTGIQPVETPTPVVTVPAELVDQGAADALDAVIHEQLAQLTDPEPVPPAPNPEPDAPAPAERKRTMAPRPDPSTPFNDEELAKLPNWAQGKVRTLNAQLVHALEAVARTKPSPDGHPAPNPADVYVVFDGPPGPEAGRFVECEDADGHGINAGEWTERPNGWWALRIPRTGNPQPAVKVQADQGGGWSCPCDCHTSPLDLEHGHRPEYCPCRAVSLAELFAQTRAELEELRYDYAARLARIAELVNDGLELAEVGEADGDEDD